MVLLRDGTDFPHSHEEKDHTGKLRNIRLERVTKHARDIVAKLKWPWYATPWQNSNSFWCMQ